jgi:hypothetical protein
MTHTRRVAAAVRNSFYAPLSSFISTCARARRSGRLRSGSGAIALRCSHPAHLRGKARILAGRAGHPGGSPLRFTRVSGLYARLARAAPGTTLADCARRHCPVKQIPTQGSTHSCMPALAEVGPTAAVGRQRTLPATLYRAPHCVWTSVSALAMDSM